MIVDTLTESAVFMSQDSSRFDGSVGTEHAENRSGCGSGRNGADPESTSRSRLELGVHSSKTCVVRAGFRSGAARRGGHRTIEVCSFCRGNRSTVRLSEANTNSLAVGHTDITTKAVENVFFSSDSISLVDKVDEATFLCTL